MKKTIPALLMSVACMADTPELLVNRQGLAQQDFSIRGSSYTGAGISINGLKLKSPYSAHFNTELPIAGHWLSNAKVQNQTVTYEMAPQAARLQTGLEIGTTDHYAAELSSYAAGVGGFLEWESARQVDDDANDYERHSGGAHLQHSANDWQLDLIGAGQEKEFGTQGYYGLGTGEQTVEDALLLFSAAKGDLEDSFLRTGAAVRQMEIDGGDSRFATAMIEGRTMEIQHVALTLRGDVENEYYEGHDRTRGSVLILPEACFDRFSVRAGLNTVFQSDESAEWLPQAGVDFYATDNSILYAAWTETVQQPDFQTLESNPLLQQQKTQNAELGFRRFVSENLDWRAAAFHRRLENASDWIGGVAADLGTVNVAGFDSKLSFYPSDELELTGYYQWIHKDNTNPDGRYESDFPEHLLAFSGHWTFARGLTLFGAQTLRWQTDNSARTSSDFGADASVGLHWVPAFAHNARLSFRVENLWGSNFQAIPGVEPRDRTAHAGITVTW